MTILYTSYSLPPPDSPPLDQVAADTLSISMLRPISIHPLKSVPPANRMLSVAFVALYTRGEDDIAVVAMAHWSIRVTDLNPYLRVAA